MDTIETKEEAAGRDCYDRFVSEIKRKEEAYWKQAGPIMQDMGLLRKMYTQHAIKKDKAGNITHYGEAWTNEAAKENYESGEETLKQLRRSIFSR